MKRLLAAALAAGLLGAPARGEILTVSAPAGGGGGSGCSFTGGTANQPLVATGTSGDCAPSNEVVSSPGNALELEGAADGGTNNAQEVYIVGGASITSGGSGARVLIEGGVDQAGDDGGSISLNGGDVGTFGGATTVSGGGDACGNAGGVLIFTTTPEGGGTRSGDTMLEGGDAGCGDVGGGDVEMLGGEPNGNGVPGRASMIGNDDNNGGDGAAITAYGGDGSGNGGNVVLNPGAGTPPEQGIISLQGQAQSTYVAISAIGAVGVSGSCTGGTDYQVGDVLTPTGPAPIESTTAATFTVASVDAATPHCPVTLTVTNPGAYTVVPADPVTTSGGSGTGAELYFSSTNYATGNGWAFSPALAGNSDPTSGLTFDSAGEPGLFEATNALSLQAAQVVGVDAFANGYAISSKFTGAFGLAVTPPIGATNSIGVLELDAVSPGGEAPAIFTVGSRGAAGATSPPLLGDGLFALFVSGANETNNPNVGIEEIVNAAEDFSSGHTAANWSLKTVDTLSEADHVRIEVDGNGDTQIENGHLGFINSAPTLSACGTGSPALDATASDTAGTVTEGTAATGCTVTFAVAYASPPHCVVQGSDATVTVPTPATDSALTYAHAVASADTFTYECFQ